MGNFLSTTVLAWLSRRALELGGLWLVSNGLATEGNVDEYLGAAALLGGLIWNAISSFFPHLTANMKRVPLAETSPIVKEAAERVTAPK